MERTFVALKPDAIARGLSGEILARFEKAGLKLVGAKMMMVPKELAERHYPADREELIVGIGNKTLENYGALEMDAKAELGTDDPAEIGMLVRTWLIDFMTSGPVLAMAFEAPHAVELVRKMVGHTLPLNSAPGTIRGDLSYDSSYLANTRKRPIKNLIHASGNVAEAEYELGLWFSENELCSYKRTEEYAME